MLQIIEPTKQPNNTTGATAKRPLIVELSSTDTVNLVQSLMERVVGGSDALQVRVCIGNALIVLAGASGDVRRQRCFGTIVNGALRALRNAEAGLLPLLLQMLFTWVYHGRMLVAPFAAELVQVALQAARSGQSLTRFGAVKLLGALLSNEATDELMSTTESPLSDVAETLAFVAADGASDAGTRALAEQLSGALKVR
jgi:HEAT repeat protein